MEELENQSMVDGEPIKRKCFREEEYRRKGNQQGTEEQNAVHSEEVVTSEALRCCNYVELEEKKT